MKSADVWVGELFWGNRINRQDIAQSPRFLRQLIRSIQLDAYKEGMTRAAEIAHKWMTDQQISLGNGGAGAEILRERDAKKTL